MSNLAFSADDSAKVPPIGCWVYGSNFKPYLLLAVKTAKSGMIKLTLEGLNKPVQLVAVKGWTLADPATLNGESCSIEIEHPYNGKTFTQQLTNGYVHLGQMAEAAGRRLDNWLRLKSTKELLVEFKRQNGDFSNPLLEGVSIDTSDLRERSNPLLEGVSEKGILTGKGGAGGGGATWAHPHIAIQFAQWCNPAFALFVSRIFEEWLTTRVTRNDVNTLVIASDTTALEQELALTKAKLAATSDLIQASQEHLDIATLQHRLMMVKVHYQPILAVVNYAEDFLYALTKEPDAHVLTPQAIHAMLQPLEVLAGTLQDNAVIKKGCHQYHVTKVAENAIDEFDRLIRYHVNQSKALLK